MVDPSSSENLRPRHGARFVLVLRERGARTSYHAKIHLPTHSLEANVDWAGDEPAIVQPQPPDPWVREELLKLVRVLRRDPRPEMTRWRGREE